MATGYMNILLSNGETVYVIIHTTAVIGEINRVSKNGAATSSSPTTFSVGSRCTISDITESANVTGEFEIISNGQRTGVKIPTDTRFLGTQAGRDKYIPKIGFRPGVTYSLIQTVAHT